MANSLEQAIQQAIMSINQKYRSPISIEKQISSLSNPQVGPLIENAPARKSDAWIDNQIAMTKAASEAGLPYFKANAEDSAARLRLKDAIARAEASGLNVPHFIGTPTEPTGDRGVSMDVENLVQALQHQENQAILAGNKDLARKTALERAFWENEAASGMSAAEWKAQTGENDPQYP